MTRLLVSVRDAAEACDAIAGGADLIDVKEPLKGSLGAASAPVVREIIDAVDGRRPASVAIGELTDVDDADLSYCVGARFAKVGLAGCTSDLDWPRRWQAIVARLPQSVQPVAVIYADYETCDAPNPDQVLLQAARLGCAAVLLDTFDKTRGRLPQQWTLDRLARFAEKVRGVEMRLVLAGSLAIEDIASLRSLDADYFAVRSAVCGNARTGRLERHLVERFAQQMNGQSTGRESNCKYLAKFLLY